MFLSILHRQTKTLYHMVLDIFRSLQIRFFELTGECSKQLFKKKKEFFVFFTRAALYLIFQNLLSLSLTKLFDYYRHRHHHHRSSTIIIIIITLVVQVKI